ncbi:MAG: succinate dehydrogenase, hydrophobic membrane anchor protein [Burkholderiales bacterium]|nr:succinate dehydrogenase, hydrophobic membrane anchor protein [Burkholderiales bacterium]
MSVNYGSKRVVVGAHYGLRDWLSQRVTAALMALFTLALLVQVAWPGRRLGYDLWAGIFAAQWMKVLTFAVIVALGWHAWVGMRDVLMDYVKPVGVRLVLQVATIVWFVGNMGWMVQVLWRL